jgi:protein ImuB
LAEGSHARSLGRQALFKRWGIKTLGELAALPPADLAARLGHDGLVYQAIARGDDGGWPLVPTLPDECFESSLELEWPIDGLEPLSFVLTRLLEPLSTRLERRDRGAAVLHVLLRLSGTGLGSCSTRDPSPAVHARSLQLPSPMRDVKTLRTLALLDLESHPPSAAVDRVTVVIDPTPGRILQHTLFTRALPTAEQLSTLLARLAALMGQDRIGAPATVDSYRPGAFEMRPFATERPTTFLMARGAPPPRAEDLALERRLSRSGEDCHCGSQPSALSPQPLLRSALRRCRQPVPARVALAGDRPARVTTDRRGFVGGRVLAAVGPWRTSGQWWNQSPVPGHQSPVTSPKSSVVGRQSSVGSSFRALKTDDEGPRTDDCRLATGDWRQTTSWNRDEWDVSLDDGASYRVFRDRETDRWFIDAIVD